MASKKNKEDEKGFLKYYRMSKITAKIIRFWLLIFVFIAVVRLVFIELISKIVHFVRGAVTSNPDGYLKDLFPRENRRGEMFDDRFLFDIDRFLGNSIFITLVLLAIFGLFIMLRPRNAEKASFLYDIESIIIKRIIIKATEARRKKTYKDENRKFRKYKRPIVKANKRIRKCDVEMHTYNKYNAPG